VKHLFAAKFVTHFKKKVV